ncbi:single-stranded nucleic acid binding r3h domain-containing protein [Leptolyngbya sp. Heron Island J]|uniref:R3H domain-containing nucleic acid-binding protein n=1 Tax=Leptolyngbya sp. Heron Island J TaxID=1385935 RepID=UPI0003B98218|nr:R3H domain-containing nucleic acid-binding protein [Leptolyngbya sp. Heron Island J]ESA38044.1 single-stranded nucleic acid binding r3h domain-containing protein [Leptolyngbya sp. Heron Island J]
MARSDEYGSAPESISAFSSSNAPIHDDLNQLLSILPPELRQPLSDHPKRSQLIEVILDLGRRPEARFPGQAEYLAEQVISKTDLEHCIERVGTFGGDNRAGIEKTLHRISAMRNRAGTIIGLTCRVGRAVFGTVEMIRDLVEAGQSILLLGRPGVGKTTALREIARVLADDLSKRVVIIDTSNEIAGDGDIPHPAIGRARRMQVAHPEQQHQVMIEAVENHTPEVIIIDEIGTELEALAARTIAERGVQLVGTAHGNQLENLIKNPTLADLIGGIQTVTLGDDEARRRGSQKSVLERKAPPTFDMAVEMLERQRWVVHEDVAATVDHLLRGRTPETQIRTVGDNGKVLITHELPDVVSQRRTTRRTQRGWREAGQMEPVAPRMRQSAPAQPTPLPLSTAHDDFQALLDRQMDTADLELSTPVGPNGEDLVTIYPYGISREQLHHVIDTLKLPVSITKELGVAQAVLALRSHVRNHSKLKTLAKSRQLPIYTVKSNTIPQITRALQRLLDIDPRDQSEAIDLSLFTRQGQDDELEALEEARLAVEQIVIPKGQPVELLPRSAKIRKMQHELAEHYRLKSLSFGDEPNRRLRIFPA